MVVNVHWGDLLPLYLILLYAIVVALAQLPLLSLVLHLPLHLHVVLVLDKSTVLVHHLFVALELLSHGRQVDYFLGLISGRIRVMRVRRDLLLL